MDLILKDNRIFIPNRIHEAILKLIHEGHLGLNKWKLHAKETVYWPGLNDQLERLVLNCELCLKYSYYKWKQEPSLSLGQEQQTSFTLREHPIYLLLGIPTDFQLCTSLHQLLVNILQINAS